MPREHLTKLSHHGGSLQLIGFGDICPGKEFIGVFHYVGLGDQGLRGEALYVRLAWVVVAPCN